jgi:hypothetical protein
VREKPRLEGVDFYSQSSIDESYLTHSTRRYDMLYIRGESMSKPKDQMRYLNVNRYLLHKTPIASEDPKRLEKKVQDILKGKISGISFSPYLEGQDPGIKSVITEKQIADRLEIIRPYTAWIRTFSTTLGNEQDIGGCMD